MVYGTSTGLTFAGHQIFNMIFFDTLEIGDLFGTALAAGRFFHQTQAEQDLAVGIPKRLPEFGTFPFGSLRGGPTESGASLVIRSSSLFADGFESGDVGEWSDSSP